MVIFLVGDRIIASHMPLANSKHAFQILLELDLKGERRDKLTHLIGNHKFITIMPEVFSLTKLRNGVLKNFKATVFTDHFERNGTPVIKDVSFMVKRLLLNKSLSSIESDEYFTLKIDKKHRLLVHEIGKLPSFDQILLQTKTNDSTSTKSVYLETQDFLQ